MKVELQPMPAWLEKAKPEMLCMSKDLFAIFGYRTTNGLTGNQSAFPPPDFKRGDHLISSGGRKVFFRHNYWKAETVRQEYFRRKDLQDLLACR